MNKEDLEYDISIALARWNEYSHFRLAGVENLTRADIDTLLMCCDYYDQHGNLNGLRFFSPEVKAVLKNYGML